MSREKLLAAFIEEVWSQGHIEACDDFIGETYTVRPIRTIPGTARP